MRKIYSLLITTLIALTLLSAQPAKATHFMGANITYRCIGANEYEFTLAFYRDCAGIEPSNTAKLNIQSALCSMNTNITLQRVVSGLEVTPLCPAQLANSSCNGGSLPGVKQYVYKGKAVLAGFCSDFKFYYEDCCRNDMLTNVVSPGTTGFRITSTLNNSVYNCNNSPVFNAPSSFFFLNRGQKNIIDGSATDYDGDSLTYELVIPVAMTDTPILYKASFNYLYPLTDATGNAVINPATGAINITPTNLEKSVIAIKVSEYRKGTLIGTSIADIELVVMSNPPNLAPYIVGAPIQKLTGGTLSSGNRIKVCPGGSISFDTYFADADGNTLVVNSNKAYFTGMQVNTTTLAPDSVKVHVTWAPVDTIGVYQLMITATDNSCPMAGQAVLSVSIEVMSGTFAGNDIAICAPDKSISLSAKGGTTFAWAPATGLSATNIANPVASPTVTTTYTLQSNATVCGVADTVIVYVLPALTGTITATPKDACYGIPVKLSVTAAGGLGSNYEYAWVFGSIILPTAKTDTSFTPFTSASYFVNIKSLNCTATYKVYVASHPRLYPAIAPEGPEITICYGDTQSLTSNYATGNHWSTLDTTQTIRISKPGVYTDTIITKYGCMAIADPITLILDSLPIADFAFVPNALSCSFTSLSKYYKFIMWDFGDGTTRGAIASVSHTYAVAGTYSVKLIASDSCGSDTITKTVSVGSGIETIHSKPTFTLLSNPCNNCTLVGKVNPADVSVTDILGRDIETVYSRVSQGYTLQFSNTAPGIYFIRDRKSGSVIKFIRE